jgi:hypothetical protein
MTQILMQENATKLHMPRRRPALPPVDPGKPHLFVEVNDAGMGAAASGSGGNRSTSSLMATVVTTNYMRKSRCGVPGCGRDRHDEMHAAPEG